MIVRLTLVNDLVVRVEMSESADIDLVDRNIRMSLSTDATVSLIDKDDVHHFYPSRSIRFVRLHPKGNDDSTSSD